jgi:TetR/AcrR family transcriptional repressor of mexJK operon
MTTKAPALTGEKETLILDAAQKRFATYGPGKVTMDEIAADVGMGKASLYYYFPTKEHLFRSVIAREQTEFLNRLKDILSRDICASEKLKLYTEQRLEYIKTLLNLQFLNLSSYLNPKPIFRDLFESFSAEEQKRLTDVIREGKRNGEFDVKSPEATATLLLHVLQGLRLRMLKGTRLSDVHEIPSEELAREMRLVVEVFVNGIRKIKTPLKAERA